MEPFNANDLFGFKTTEKEQPPKPQDGLPPIHQFGTQKLLTLLKENKLLGDVGKYKYTDEVVWGTGSGSVRVKISPNMGVTIDRKSEDRTNDPVWVTKRAYRIKIEDFSGREGVVAGEIFSELEEIVKHQNDAPKEKFNILPLVNRVVDNVKRISGIFVYQRTVKNDENWYTLVFSLKGAGAGQLVRQTKGGPTPAGVLELVFYPSLGYMKTIINTIGIEGESGAWVILVPNFVANFMPTQDKEEISDAIVAGFRWF